MNEWMLRKPQKCTCMAFFPDPERTSWSLTPQLDTVIIEVSSVKGLIRPERLYTETIQGQTFAINGYGDTEFSTAANLSYDLPSVT